MATIINFLTLIFAGIIMVLLYCDRITVLHYDRCFTNPDNDKSLKALNFFVLSDSLTVAKDQVKCMIAVAALMACYAYHTVVLVRLDYLSYPFV